MESCITIVLNILVSFIAHNGSFLNVKIQSFEIFEIDYLIFLVSRYCTTGMVTDKTKSRLAYLEQHGFEG